MHRLILDYDPLTGVTEHMEFQNDAVKIVRSQDVTPILEVAKSMASSEDYTKRGIKQDHWHYARIPDIVMEEMWTKHHVKWEDRNDKGHKKFLRVLNKHYPAFKTTAWNHE